MNFYKSENLIFWKKVFSKPNSVLCINAITLRNFREINFITDFFSENVILTQKMLIFL